MSRRFWRAFTICTSFSRVASKTWLRVSESLGEPGDHRRIDRIVLGEPPGRSGEVAHPLRVDDPDFDAGLAQRLGPVPLVAARSEEHTSELQSRENLVCRLL